MFLYNLGYVVNSLSAMLAFLCLYAFLSTIAVTPASFSAYENQEIKPSLEIIPWEGW